jgi:hypothetical protein
MTTITFTIDVNHDVLDAESDARELIGYVLRQNLPIGMTIGDDDTVTGPGFVPLPTQQYDAEDGTRVVHVDTSDMDDNEHGPHPLRMYLNDDVLYENPPLADADATSPTVRPVLIVMEGGLVTHISSPDRPVVVIDYDTDEADHLDDGIWSVPQGPHFDTGNPVHHLGFVTVVDKPEHTDDEVDRFARSMLLATECGRCTMPIRPDLSQPPTGPVVWVDQTDGDHCDGADNTEDTVHVPAKPFHPGPRGGERITPIGYDDEVGDR